ncbi:lipopolysaccharide biosynthesis protein [Nitrincola tibetensis]|uniref:non-specific protein-tyrosine kinase n=1 Tax=Nitrincola tibetensis TaxID=2219697 RepID=A0A364NME5_9GAMM|nr:polysaccharide biosynthesis tyrosine autokinase [Nitrincola tibetensis]RAU18253.1 lipopolysaccharide biosynthesis protein [Nitrincola tibetensis]
MDSNTLPATESRNWLREKMDNDEIDLLALWNTLWRRKWSIITLVFIVMVLTTLVVMSITPIYRAASTLLIEQKGARVLSIEQVYGVDGSGNEYLQTQFELLKSRALAERVVRRLNLHTHYEFDPAQQEPPLVDIRGMLKNFDINQFIPGIVPEDLEEPIPVSEDEIIERVTRAFMERVTISPVGRSQLVRINVDMADRFTAAAAANALAEGFIDGQLDASMEMTMSATTWMNSRLSELRLNLQTAEDRLQSFRDAEGIVDVGGILTVTASELSATSDRMIDARRNRAEAESEFRQVQAMRSGGWERLASIPAVLSNPLIQTFKAEEARARARVDELSSRYGARHPAMEAAQSDLNAARASLRTQVEQIVAGIERNYQLSVANEQSLRRSVEENKEQIQDISRKEFQLRELQREVDANRTLYDTFMTRLKETTATSDLETANARIVDRAVVPEHPIKPRKSLIILISGIMAGMFGVGLTLLLSALNNTFKSIEEVENKLNLPVLGILPLLSKKDRKAMAHMFSENKDKTFAESIRTIRTGLVLSGIDKPHKVIMVTSSIPNEGKSTVAANLASALGQMESVILIEADMRRPTMARSFEFAPGTAGLANLISGTATLEEAINIVDGIDVLSAGVVPPNPLELLSNPRFKEVLDKISQKYDRVIIDSPPVQAVSDALVLSTHANAVVYVIKSDATARPLAIKGVGQLLQSNAPITGVVLNQVDIRKAKKQGYNYGGYYDYYGYSGGNKA